MASKQTDNSSQSSPDPTIDVQDSLESRSPAELVHLVQQSLEKQLEWEAKHQQLEAFQSQSTELLNTIITKLDAQELPEYSKDAAAKIGGLQTELSLSHEKQQALETEKCELEERLSETGAQLDKLQAKHEELETRCCAMQREMAVLQTAKQNAVEQRAPILSLVFQ